MTDSESDQYIDVTPTWEEILPNWLMLYQQAVLGNADNSREVIANAKTEFFRMARAADKWNAHCRESTL
jgi:hypothetical protein